MSERSIALDQVASWFPSADLIVARARRVIEAGEPPGLVQLLEQVGAPVLDLVATPYAAAAAAIAARVGRAFHAHETRRRIPMPKALAPEIDVWGGGTLPEWRLGVLEEPKYFSFFQDAPIHAFNPNHRRKWRPHELLHGALLFHWHPALTRFESYLGARLNELLPVVHWYGFDEVFRPRSNAGLGKLPGRAYDAASEASTVPFWELSHSAIEELEAAAAIAAERTRNHFIEEWEAVLQEVSGGARVVTRREHLNASSDAVGYLRGHWNRITAWSFGSWVEYFLVDGVDYHSRLDRYIEHCAGVALDLSEVDQALATGGQIGHQDYARLRLRRVLQDLGYRTFVALEHLAEGLVETVRAEECVMPALGRCAELSQALLDDGGGPAALAAARSSVEDLLLAIAEAERIVPEGPFWRISKTGYAWPDVAEITGRGIAEWADCELLAEGIASAMPRTWELLGEGGEGLTIELAETMTTAAEGHLGGRLVALMDDRDDLSELTKAWARFEAWACRGPMGDDEAELFATVPANVAELLNQPGNLRCHATFRSARFAEAVVVELLGDAEEPHDQPDSRAEVALGGIYRAGALRLKSLTTDESAILERFAVPGGPDDLRSLGPESIELTLALIEHGFLVWQPRP